jgi:hypothetical protein
MQSQFVFSCKSPDIFVKIRPYGQLNATPNNSEELFVMLEIVALEQKTFWMFLHEDFQAMLSVGCF